MKHEWTMGIVGLLLLIAGARICYAIAKRKFNRRAMTGAEGFRSFEHAWVTNLGETLLKWISIVLLISGLLILVSALGLL